MSSNLYLYSENIFINPNVIKYIASNIAYCKLFNKPYKDMYFEGNENNICNFIKILQKSLYDSIERYEYLGYKNLRYCQFVIFEKQDLVVKDDKYSNIMINKLKHLNYLTSHDSVIIFNDQKYQIDDVEIINISKELEYLINKYVNVYKGHVFYEDLVSGENYNLFLHQKYIIKKIYDKDITKFNLFESYNGIKDWCNKNIKINEIKEYITIIFGNPSIYNEWKLE